MSLESLLKPVKAVDEELLRGYTKFFKFSEKIGISRYTHCYFGIAESIVGLYIGFHELREAIGDITPISMTYSMTILMPEISRTVEEHLRKRNIETEERVKYVYSSSFAAFSKLTSKYLRLPFFLSTVSFGVKSLFELYNGVFHQDSEAFSQSLTDLVIAGGFFGISSSMYLKDADPNILKKDPLLKRMYNWAKEKVSSYMPAPRPVPVQAYSRLEEIIE